MYGQALRIDRQVVNYNGEIIFKFLYYKLTKTTETHGGSTLICVHKFDLAKKLSIQLSM